MSNATGLGASLKEPGLGSLSPRGLVIPGIQQRRVCSSCLCATARWGAGVCTRTDAEAETGMEHSRQDIAEVSPERPHPAPRHHARLAVTCPRSSPAPAAAFGNPQHVPPRSKQVPVLPTGAGIPLHHTLTVSLPAPGACQPEPCWQCRGYSQDSRAMN